MRTSPKSYETLLVASTSYRCNHQSAYHTRVTIEMSSSYDYLFKIVVLGEGAVGKTAIVTRFSHGFFRTDYKTTIGSQFAVKNVEIPDLGCRWPEPLSDSEADVLPRVEWWAAGL
jgi:hypothetical protein